MHSFGSILKMHKFDNTTATYDYFGNLFNDNATTRYFFLAFAIFSIFFGTLALYCIIWFEKFGSNSKRTLLNMLASLGCWSFIEFIIFIEIPEILRYLSGPFNPMFCFFHQIIRTKIYCDVLLQLDAMTLVRYICIFCLKNPAGINDEFWIVFINIFIKIFNIITMFAFHLLASRQPFGYYVCTGQDPNADYKKTVKFYPVYELLTIFLHIAVNFKIYLFKKKESSVDVKYGNQKSMTNFKIDYTVSIFLLTTLINMLKLSTTKPEDLHKYPNYLFVYYRSLAMPGVGIILLFSMYFTRHSSLRRLVIDELGNLKQSLC